ncbi:MAG TPA: hypothetical protein VMI54_07825, partial [Polyangiaceae bacterium]|nr:hypothetical protein [Polyangiaceae bacterium]
AGTGGTSGDGTGGSTGTGGNAGSVTAGFPSTGGTSGNSGAGEAGAETGGSSATGGFTSSGGVTGNGGQAAEAGEAGAGGTGPAACDPESPTAGCVLTTGFSAIYVAPPSAGGDDQNNGTQSAPVASITHALELPGANVVPIFVCAGTYQEHVEITVTGISLHGAYTCQSATWTYDPTSTSRLAPTTKDEALRVKSVDRLSVTDMELASANASDPGASSVAVFVSDSKAVTFVRDHIVAGDGVKGANGVLEAYTYPATDDLKGNPAKGAAPGAARSDCPICPGGDANTSGGVGGLAQQSGTPGEPQQFGGGTAGQVDGTECSNGGRGGDAPGADQGDGASVPGVLGSDGWTPSDGQVGADGVPGQGGGGGGGAPTSGAGAGGGGACGGCGGSGGPAGSGGGSSIAILAFGSNLSLQDCAVETGNAGDGGTGKAGQQGQDGGIGGDRTGSACLGGNGGKGGDGGAGGGGAGGISVGVVSDMTSKVTSDDATTYTVGTPGMGGHGAGTDDNGVNGVAQEQLSLSGA